jgi:hypothetical protein
VVRGRGGQTAVVRGRWDGNGRNVRSHDGTILGRANCDQASNGHLLFVFCPLSTKTIYVVSTFPLLYVHLHNAFSPLLFEAAAHTAAAFSIRPHYQSATPAAQQSKTLYLRNLELCPTLSLAICDSKERCQCRMTYY